MNQALSQSTSSFSPKKQLGQNFLKNRAVLLKIIAAADLKKSDLVLEVGPGQGVLTAELAQGAKKVIAIEKDNQLISVLRQNLAEFNNIEIVQGDARDLIADNRVPVNNYKVVANLPYYAATHIIRQFLEAKNKPKLMIVMVQKEVGQRICSQPPEMSLLAVSTQFYAKTKIISYVKKDAFWPKPKVDSAILRIRSLINTDKKQINTDLFFRIVKSGFSQPRKQLANNLIKKLELPREKIIAWLEKNSLRPEQRAQALSVRDWLNLTQTYPFFFS